MMTKRERRYHIDKQLVRKLFKPKNHRRWTKISIGDSNNMVYKTHDAMIELVPNEELENTPIGRGILGITVPFLKFSLERWMEADIRSIILKNNKLHARKGKKISS